MKHAATVCILTAGKGTRMGTCGEHINKALLPLAGKAIISHIIGKFPQDTAYVVGTGYLSDQVEHYLAIAHPDRNITCVTIDNYDGPGSGPGYSLLCCSSHLQRPFYFVSCDTLWDNQLPPPGDFNWLGVASVPGDDTARYCNMRVADGCIVELRDKQKVDDPTYQAFVGLCYIYDHGVFWKSLGDKSTIAGERQVSNGLRELIKNCRVKAQHVEWTDVGDAEKYKQAVLRFEEYDFSKTNEYLYMVGGKVIKFFVDHKVTAMRVQKASLNPGVFPAITDHTDGFYAYQYQPGETLYRRNSFAIFASLLQWLEANLWKPVAIDPPVIAEACRRFYRDKTIKRIEAYQKKHHIADAGAVINGTEIPPMKDLLAKVPWDLLEQGVACFMHGDLQFDNIIYDAATRTFKLLDWRQDFDGHVEFGDIYYDVAKMYGGMILNYDFIKKNLLSYCEDDQGVYYDFAQRHNAAAYIDILTCYVVNRGWDIDKVRLLVAIIYLNMSPLHTYPFDKMLYALGRKMLATELGMAKD